MRGWYGARRAGGPACSKTINESSGRERVAGPARGESGVELLRRGRDKIEGRYGTAVARFGRDVHRVAWAEPTPHQSAARPRIPSDQFEWRAPIGQRI